MIHGNSSLARYTLEAKVHLIGPRKARIRLRDLFLEHAGTFDYQAQLRMYWNVTGSRVGVREIRRFSMPGRELMYRTHDVQEHFRLQLESEPAFIIHPMMYVLQKDVLIRVEYEPGEAELLGSW